MRNLAVGRVATVARSMPQFGVLLLLVLLPLQILSGAVTPRESQPEFVQLIMFAAPTTHFIQIGQGILLGRGIRLDVAAIRRARADRRDVLLAVPDAVPHDAGDHGMKPGPCPATLSAWLLAQFGVDMHGGGCRPVRPTLPGRVPLKGPLRSPQVPGPLLSPYLISPSARIAARTAGRAATRSWNSARFANSERSSFANCAQLVTVNR